MKLDAPTNEIKFHEATPEATFFMLLLDGEPTMKIMCVPGDPAKTIRIGRADGTGYQATKGCFTMTTKLLEDVEGAPLGTEVRVDRLSVYKYVVPRMHVLIGRLLRAAN